MPPSKREELVDAAMRVFYRNGFHTTNIDQVLREAGVSRMTLYNHFKSKDELIVAALRRRDETFRNSLVKHVAAHAETPRERLLAVFDFITGWIDGDEFHGCMFINAAAAFGDRECAIRRFASEHKRILLVYLREQCAEAGLADPDEVAEELHVLVEGAIVSAQVLDRGVDRGRDRLTSARSAKCAATKLIELAMAA